MIDVTYLYGFLLGVIAGLYYFFGLWLTVKKVVSSAKPKRLLVLSFIARLLPTLIIMLIAARYNPGLFFTLLPGFFLVRFVMTRKLGLSKEPVHAAQP